TCTVSVALETICRPVWAGGLSSASTFWLLWLGAAVPDEPVLPLLSAAAAPAPWNICPATVEAVAGADADVAGDEREHPATAAAPAGPPPRRRAPLRRPALMSSPPLAAAPGRAAPFPTRGGAARSPASCPDPIGSRR